MPTKFHWTPFLPQGDIYGANFIGDDGIAYGSVTQDSNGFIDGLAFSKEFNRRYDRAPSVADARIWVQRQFCTPGTVIVT